MKNRPFLLSILIVLSTAVIAQQSTLIISSDAACTLTVNGMPQGQVAAGTAKAVPVETGEQFVECVGAGGAVAEQIFEALPGAQIEVSFALADKVAAAARFKADTNRVIDTRTGLTWLASDNGREINWNDALSYCDRVSPGSWSLPSMKELEAISGKSGAKGSSLFKLSACCYWSNESKGPSEAWTMVLRNANQYSIPVSDSNTALALCVRRRS